MSSAAGWPNRALTLIQSRRFPAARLITDTQPLAAITEAFPLMESGEALKVCIDAHKEW